ncbi:MAG: DUF6036 family nucleotidyltransferase [Planctomycetota bacterium]
MWLVLVYTIYMKLKSNDILDALNATAEHMEWNGDPVEILLIGGAGAMLTGMLRSERVTQDCDVIDYQPQDGQQAVLAAAAKVAAKKGLPEKWLNSKAMGLDILSDGWRSRRILIKKFDTLWIYGASRVDMLVMKFYANRPQDREDIFDMAPTPDELAKVRRYLDMMRVPSKQANLDQVASAFELLDAVEGKLDET